MARSAGLPVQFVGDGFIQTGDVGGSRFPFLASSAINPHGMVGSTTTTSLATLSVPPTYSTMGGGAAYQGGMSPSQAAAAEPWSPRSSPLPIVVAAIVLGMLAVHKLYFEKR